MYYSARRWWRSSTARLATARLATGHFLVPVQNSSRRTIMRRAGPVVCAIAHARARPSLRLCVLSYGTISSGMREYSIGVSINPCWVEKWAKRFMAFGMQRGINQETRIVALEICAIRKCISCEDRVNMDYFSLLQWPAMVINIFAVWLLTFPSKRTRHAGFICSLLSNVLWVAWGWYVQAFAVIGLQIALATLNIRGVKTTD